MLRLLPLCAVLCLSVLTSAQDDAPATLDVGDARHVRAVYLDLHGRTPYEHELELAAAGTPEALVRYLLSSRRFWEHWFENELYYFLLIDNARPEEVTGPESIPWRLHEGELDVLAGVRELVAGQAFHRANPGNDTFVSVVLEQLLDVDVRREHAQLEAGKKMYDGRRGVMYGQEGNSQADIVRIVSSQPGFSRGIVARAYRQLVGAAPERAELEEWSTALEAESAGLRELVSTWMLSPAYAARLGTLRPKTDMQFIRGLYVDLARREPDAEELQRLRGALGVLADAAPLRAVIARTLLDREADDLPRRQDVDAGEFVDRTFRRYLGRGPSREEREEFLLVFAQEECDPATLVRAVVTHWEYQYY
ncbi:MAG: hypothetical protein ACYTG2_00360 [Planctomycetota bacterium]|jgi:hypothetical protein